MWLLPQYRSRIRSELDVATLTELNNTEGTSYLQKYSKFDEIDLRLTSDFSFETTISKKFYHRKD